MNDDHAVLEAFSGLVRLFPLPNLVVFPHVPQPLHIFEPRYRQMIGDALAGDRLIAMALLQAGWEPDYEGRPPIHPVVCLGRIQSGQRLADGRFNLVLRGLIRARVEAEVSADTLYRQARVQLIADCGQPCPAAACQLRRQLAELSLPHFAAHGVAAEHLQMLISSDRPLGVVCDILSYALPLPLEVKQQLLGEGHVERRAQALMQILGPGLKPGCAGGFRPFPPGFSSN